MALRADTVIVGAGTAGCLLAEQLTRDSGREVLLIERGPGAAFDSPLTTLPIAPSARAVPMPEARGRPVIRGAGLGGSSSINGAYFMRGHRADYERWPWPEAEIEAAFDEAERLMRVSAFDDDELGDVAAAFEAVSGSAARGRWPVVGVNRVRSNRTPDPPSRWTSAHALAAAGERSGLRVLADTSVTALGVHRSRVTGVVVTSPGGVQRVDADEVILCAGTLGTATLLLPLLGALPVHEHAERIVRFDARRPLHAPALLQSVLHTDDGLEIRAFGDDFSAFAPSVLPAGVPVGVADMAGTSGTLRATDSGPAVDLGMPDDASSARMLRGVEHVVQLLESDAFADLVSPGSARVDPVVGMSQHAWGALPAGTASDAQGRLVGFDGVRVVDGSVLPGPLRSGPHASIAMLAVLVGSRMRGAAAGHSSRRGPK